MELVKECIERIKVIKGVSNGLVSYEQIKTIIDFYDLNEEQIKALMKELDSNNIQPIPEAKFPRKEVKRRRGCDEAVRYAISKQDRERRFKKELELCLEALKKNPSLLKQYDEELLILRKYIAEYGEKYEVRYEKQEEYILDLAVREIGNLRVKDIRSKGWVCGTYMARLHDRFLRWIFCTFTQEELKELINSCGKEGELTSYQKAILFVLLHKAPEVLVHPRISKYIEE